ncbi:MAG: hypothetical protein ABSA75_08540, partial [Candidatus Bathyarchaeia archaeon]
MSEFFTTNKLVNIRGNNKTTICAITLIAVLGLSTFAILLPKVSAQATGTGINVPSFAYINAFPSPVGVGQTISIFAWTASYPPTANGNYGDRWTNCTVLVTLPDKTTTTLGPYTSDPVGTIFENYIPTETGNYTFQFIFPGKLINNQPNGENPVEVAEAGGIPFLEAFIITGFSSLGDYYEPATSTSVTVTVQSAAIASAPAYGLPTEYWSNPVSQSGHEYWTSITGDWLAISQVGSNINDFTQPPVTAHIAWTKPINAGGIGGQPAAIASGGDNYYSYLSYEGMFGPPIIMNGQLYYNTPNPPEYGFVDVNLQTGQQVWYQNGTNSWANTGNPIQIGFGFAKQNYPQLSMGQELDYESPNQHGLIPYLWSTWTAANGSSVWSMYDPQTGNWICNLWNVPSGAGFFGASSMITDDTGTFLTYTLNYPTAASQFGPAQPATLSVWNSTETIQNTAPSNQQTNGYWMWRPPLGGQIDASIGTTTYNVTGTFPTIPTVMTGFGPSNTATLLGVDPVAAEAIYSTAPSILGMASYPTQNSFIQFAISIAPATIGQIEWSQSFPWPSGNVTLENGFMGGGVFTLFQKETTTWMAYSEHTGDHLWTSAQPEVSNHMYGITGGIYDGVLYSGDSIGEGGTIYAYNATTGTLLWSSTPTTMGYTGYWDDVPASVASFAQGNIYWLG